MAANPFQEALLQPDHQRNHPPEPQVVYSSDVRQPPFSTDTSTLLFQNEYPYVPVAGSVFQPTASDIASSHLTQMRFLYFERMKTHLASISALSGNDYNHKNPENAIFEKTRNMQDYHRNRLQEVENLATHKFTLDYLHGIMGLFKRRNNVLSREDKMPQFAQLVKHYDQKHFIKDHDHFTCGIVDNSWKWHRAIHTFEMLIQKFDTESEINKLKSAITKENRRIDEEIKIEEEEANLKNIRDLKFCEEMLKIASKCILDKTNTHCWHPDCEKMKFFIEHSTECTAKNCFICPNFLGLCTFHAKHCDEDDCQTAFCKEIKEKINETTEESKKLSRAEYS